MRRVSFIDLGEESMSHALRQMLEHNQYRHHPLSQLWDDLMELQRGLQFGYDPDWDFRFYLDDFNQVVVSIDI